MLDGKSAGAPAESPAPSSASEPAAGGASNDDLPF
jgi:hypothetical protein